VTRNKILPLLLATPIAASPPATADEAAAAEAMARALQDPLASIRMLATDNTIGFNSGEDDGVTNYNFKSVPGMTLSYNNMISFNWDADSGDEWNVPIGATLGRTFILGNGHGLDLGIGHYEMLEHPEAGPDNQLKFAITWIPG
jgi:hypothetical protein